MRRMLLGRLILLTGGLGLPLLGLRADIDVSVCADRISCRYALGETARLTVAVNDEDGKLRKGGSIVWSVDNFGSKVVQSEKTVDLAKENPFVVTVSRSTPGFARLRVRSNDENLKILKNEGNHDEEYAFGVAFAPEQIITGSPDPDDFDAFWERAIADLEANVPIDAKVEPMPECSNVTMSCFRVSFATTDGRRVYGWLTEPKDLSKGPFPVRIRVPGAGIGFVEPQFCEGCVCLSMNVHGYCQPEGKGEKADTERQRLYDEQDRKYAVPRSVKRYCQAGIHLGRENYFYYASILGINRAVNWLASRPECDKGGFTYSGTSQGGGFGLYLTALNKHITRSCIFVPALTDLLGYKIEGRQSGWPQLIEAQKPGNRADAERWAPYFCGVNFARRIHCPVRFVAGFSDGVCSPNAVFSAYNVCPSKDKKIFDGIGMGHRVYDDFYDYLSAWECEQASSKPQYRFVAFNIWGDFFGNPPHERDMQEAAIVRKWNPDFFGMQEVTATFWKSRLFPQLSDIYEVIGKGMGPRGIDAFVSIGYRKSRFDLVDKGAVWFCPELDESKGVVWAVLQDKETARRLVVFASHYWWRYDGVGDDWVRLDNSRRLFAKLTEVAQKYDAAIIGGGDLNSPVESWALKYLLENGLADAQRSALISCRNCPTEHGDPKRDANGVYVGTLGIRGINRANPKFHFLDHVFYDPKRIAVDRFDLDLSPEACSVSDHHPAGADFRLKQ